jgi:hypothetical protein
MSVADEEMTTAADDLDAPSERLRAANALGRSATIHRLFEFLLERSRAGFAPKEIEVAQTVFGRRAGFDVAQDSTVRVYVHRLRRKLEDYYAGPGRSETVRLAIPKGEYRLVAQEVDPTERATATPAILGTPAGKSRWLLAALVALVVLNLVAGGLWWRHSARQGFGFAARSPVWASMLKDGRPITLVVGDYYIFGENDRHANVSRLIREYNINSPEELSSYLMDNPDQLDRYTDLGLYYLPTSIASALHDLMPMLAPTRAARDRIRVVNASALTPDMLKTSNIVYIGYLSGLGILREPVFNGSRFQVGETYDELIDQTNNRIYQSQEGGPEFDTTETRLDYGYVSTFKGLNGNQIVIIAGNRDVGVMEAAETVSSPAGLRALAERAGKDKAFEALYQVEAINRVNLRGALLIVSPLRESRIWASNKGPIFPKN